MVFPDYPKRVFEAAELSDGTLRFLALAGALLAYWLPPFMALNEPETSLHPDLLPALGRLIIDEMAAKAAGHPGIVAPPAMIQVWTMMGLGRSRSDDDPLARAMKLFDDAGYVGVVATNCEQTYHRYLQPGERVGLGAGKAQRGFGRRHGQHLLGQRRCGGRG